MYNRPGTLTKLSNSLFARLASIGLGPSKMVMLELRGRTSGRARASAVNTVEVEGRRYLVSTRGDSEWVRKARAAGRAGESALHPGGVEGRRYVFSTRGYSVGVRNARAANGEAAIIRR